jgi:H+/Na+-translocating ferredoxin:NAD+ oxidoreductase subunit G
VSAPRGNGPAGATGGPPKGEWLPIVASMTVTCALGAAILGGVYLATDRYAEAARVQGERRAVTELLGLRPDAEVREVRQYLTRARDRVVYRTAEGGTGRAEGVGGEELVFGLDGGLVHEGPAPSGVGDLIPLGRVFVAATATGAPSGFVVEGDTRGYKNKIRFFVALDSSWNIAGVRVLEHEEDPGLGAEVATPWFQGQFAGRPLESVGGLDVTRDPMPEDWRTALKDLKRMAPVAWSERYGALRTREQGKPIYAVTGATISSRAFTDGVRATVLHFRRRWELVEPYLEGSRSEGQP